MNRPAVELGLVACVVFLCFRIALADDVPVATWQPIDLPYGALEELERPDGFRDDVNWLPVHSGGPCATGSSFSIGLNRGSTLTPDDLWCFEGSGGDPTWPLAPISATQPDWGHWSRYAPPSPRPSRWHVTSFMPGGGGGSFNAWVGCEAGVNCADELPFYATNGYGNYWDDSLVLDFSTQDVSLGGFVAFDIRFDTEIACDQLIVEGFDGTDWVELPVNGTSGVFEGTSGWVTSLSASFVGTTMIRWRASTDHRTSDQDGLVDTNGLAAIDNVVLFLNAASVMIVDDFESGDFLGLNVSSGTANWIVGGAPEKSTLDQWHLEFDPMYKNKGMHCSFSANWMWAARSMFPAFPENGFSFFLTTPTIDVAGWQNAVISYSQYMCVDPAREDRTNQFVRTYDSSLSLWTPWQDLDGVALEGGCEFWNLDQVEDLTRYLGPNVTEMQVGFELFDASKEGDLSWDNHATVQYLIDDVSIGSYSTPNTRVDFDRFGLFHDTFSLSDPAHTVHLSNDEQGQWIGTVGSRPLDDNEHLSLTVRDPDGVQDVDLHWRIGDGVGSFGPWNTKAMTLSVPMGGVGEGVYRAAIGVDDGGVEDGSGIASDNRVWDAGSLVEYYVTVEDVALNVAHFPRAAADATPEYLQFQVLPFLRDNGNGEHILIVDDFDSGVLDYENSSGFNPVGGTGTGIMVNPVCDEPEDMLERALGCLYPSAFDPEEVPRWDIYNVLTASSSPQVEPRGQADDALELGGLVDASGNPVYDAIFWLNGDLACRSLSEEGRIALAAYLDAGGNLLVSGDNVAHDLGSAGCDADAILGFMIEYLGAAFQSAADASTVDKILNVEGVPGSILDGFVYGLYGECPKRGGFDRLFLSSPLNASSGVVMTYADGDPDDNGRFAMTMAERHVGGGVGVLTGFSLSALVAKSARADILNEVITNCFGMAPTGYVPVGSIGVDAPVVNQPNASFRLIAATPNPASSGTDIRFMLPRRERVSLAIYDVTGRRVRTVFEGILDSSTHSRTWDLRDDFGERVSSGIYFSKLTSETARDSQKLVVLH